MAQVLRRGMLGSIEQSSKSQASCKCSRSQVQKAVDWRVQFARVCVQQHAPRPFTCFVVLCDLPAVVSFT